MINLIKKIFVGDESTTNTLVTLLTVGILAMTFFALVYYPMTLFEKLLTAYIGIYGTMQGFKHGRSMPEQSNAEKNPQTAPIDSSK
jgi:hypothetical protein